MTLNRKYFDYGFVGGWCIDWTVARLCAGNAAGIAEIDKMVACIRTLAKQLQDGLAM
ncbi:MAG: hypothetical protein MSA76_02275 [Clostridium sp.]|nr:hypothetical protein [Clostridium sp.]